MSSMQSCDGLVPPGLPASHSSWLQSAESAGWRHWATASKCTAPAKQMISLPPCRQPYDPAIGQCARHTSLHCEESPQGQDVVCSGRMRAVATIAANADGFERSDAAREKSSLPTTGALATSAIPHPVHSVSGTMETALLQSPPQKLTVRPATPSIDTDHHSEGRAQLCATYVPIKATSCLPSPEVYDAMIVRFLIFKHTAVSLGAPFYRLHRVTCACTRLET